MTLLYVTYQSTPYQIISTKLALLRGKRTTVCLHLKCYAANLLIVKDKMQGSL